MWPSSSVGGPTRLPLHYRSSTGGGAEELEACMHGTANAGPGPQATWTQNRPGGAHHVGAYSTEEGERLMSCAQRRQWADLTPWLVACLKRAFNGPPGSGRQALLRRDLALAARYGEDAENDGWNVVESDHGVIGDSG